MLFKRALESDAVREERKLIRETQREFKELQKSELIKANVFVDGENCKLFLVEEIILNLEFFFFEISTYFSAVENLFICICPIIFKC